MTQPDSPPAPADVQPFPAPPEERDPPDSSLVPVRQRLDGWTADKQRAFIEHLANGGTVKSACAAVAMSESSAYQLRRRPDAEAFDAAWVAALRHGLDRLGATVMDRALNGDIRQRWYKGEAVGEERVFNDRLALWLLRHGEIVLNRAEARRRRAQDFDDTLKIFEAEARAVSGEPEAEPCFSVWRNEYGFWRTDAPPPPGFCDEEDLDFGHPRYSRYLTDDERDAWESRPESEPEIDPAERARQALFALPEV